MKIRQGIVLGAVVSALGIAAASVAAYAAVPIPDAKGVIRACVKYEDINHYEQMRWITKTTCPSGEKLISWNQKGRTGDRGPQGPQGEQGIQGLPGSNAPVPHVVSDTVDLPGPAGTFGASAMCPDGEHAIAGGGFDDTSLFAVSGSGPVTVSGKSGWQTIWVTRDGSSVEPASPFRVFATCITD
jgi:hypothetical protein